MRHINSLVLLSCLLISSTCFSETSVWKIEGKGNTLYLAGAIHVLSRDDLPLPSAFDEAYKKTDILVLETDMGALFQPAQQRLLADSLRYRDGRSLKNVLSDGVYRKLERYMDSEGVQQGAFLKLRPAGIAIALLMRELQKAGIAQPGVDWLFYTKAKKAGKPMGALESPEKHIGYIASMGDGAENRFVSQTVDEVYATADSIRRAIEAWREGNRKALVGSVIANMPDSYPELYRRVLVERNARWLPQIVDMLASPEKEFVLVGAAHLVGPDGLLNMLEASGFRIVQLD